jgi:hypothetical protein
MTPDDPYKNAARICRIDQRMFIVCLVSVAANEIMLFAKRAMAKEKEDLEPSWEDSQRGRSRGKCGVYPLRWIGQIWVVGAGGRYTGGR